MLRWLPGLRCIRCGLHEPQKNPSARGEGLLKTL